MCYFEASQLKSILAREVCLHTIKRLIVDLYNRGSKVMKNARNFKGALDNFSLIPQFLFKKDEILIPLQVYTYVMTACLILLATST